MLPELILNERYPLSEAQVMEAIGQYDFRGTVPSTEKGYQVCRIGGYRLLEAPDGSAQLIGWQCNLADVQDYDIRLPTVIRIQVTAENRIAAIALDANFKGSQGIPCSWRYLNRRLQTFVGEEFSPQNPKIQDERSTSCRHTFEVFYGACVFRDWCRTAGWDDAWLSEATAAYQTEDGVIALDRNCVNGQEAVTKIEVSHFLDSIRYSRLGAIEACQEMRVRTWSIEGQEERPVGPEKVVTAESEREFRLKMMKVLSKCWTQSGKRLGMKSRFYCSHLWPPTFFGILAQMFAIVVFSGSYAYFQHCIQGLQKGEDYCACIGVCEDIGECERYFADFELEDLC